MDVRRCDMRNILFRLETGFIGAEVVEEFEFDDDWTDDDINEEFKSWCIEQMDAMTCEWEEV